MRRSRSLFVVVFAIVAVAAASIGVIANPAFSAPSKGSQHASTAGLARAVHSQKGTNSLWHANTAALAQSHAGHAKAVMVKSAKGLKTYSLNAAGMMSVLATAPTEFTA